MIKRNVCLAGVLLVVTACQPTLHDPEAFATYGQPEDLIEASVEQVTVPLDQARGIDDLISWLNQARPVRASVECANNDKLCLNAKRTLSQYSVPFASKFTQGGNQVMLTYERLTVKDCDPRFVAGSYNRYNLKSAAYGCATTSNMANMVGDKRQLTNPEMLGYMDGTHAAIAHDGSYEKSVEDGDGSLLKSLTPE